MKISKELYKRISNATSIDYEAKTIDEEYVYLDEYGIESMFKDLIYEMDKLEERKDEEIQSLKWKIQEMNDHNIY